MTPKWQLISDDVKQIVISCKGYESLLPLLNRTTLTQLKIPNFLALLYISEQTFVGMQQIKSH